jgi:hypothetical protein
MEYILFVIQDANFYSRCILVPKDKFLETRNEEYNILLEHSHKNVEIEGVSIKNLLIEEFTRKGNVGTLKVENWSSFIDNLRNYSEWGLEFCSLKDENWVKDSLTNLKSGFNHVKTYQNNVNLKKYKKKPINIVDSFLVLESANGEIFKPAFDTNEEMVLSLYS